MDLRNSLKLHPRHVPVEKAKREYIAFVSEWAKRHRLTLPEQLAIQSDEITSVLHLCIRQERKCIRQERKRGAK